MADVILICGKIGCGKTYYAQTLRDTCGCPAVILSVDEIMLAVFGQHAGELHDTYTRRVRAMLLEKSAEIAASGITVILDWGFWTKQSRTDAKAFFAARGIPAQMHCIDISDQLRQERLAARNRAVADGTYSAYFVDDNLEEKFRAMFEPPAEEEIDRWIRS